MQSEIINIIEFPEFTGIRCLMMPFIQGEASSLPKEYSNYNQIINENYLEKGEIGFLTIDEKFVESGKSQRGYNSFGINRNVHIEVGTIDKNVYNWGGNYSWGNSQPEHSWGNNKSYSWGNQTTTWGGKYNTLLDKNTKVLIANSLSNTCRYWNNQESRYTQDGDLSEYIGDYPEESGILLQKGELLKMSILTPHESINQKLNSNRQFFRIVGKGVIGKEKHFTINPLVSWN
jgi:hypothetical protein